MVKNISMNVDETLELDYLVEEITDDVVKVSSEPTSGASSIDYIATQTSVFNPSEAGTYKLNINGQTIEIDVVDIPDSEGFEHNDLTGTYGGDTGTFQIQTATVNEETYALEELGDATGTAVIVRSTQDKWSRYGIQMSWKQYYDSTGRGGVGIFTTVDGVSSVSGYRFHGDPVNGNVDIYRVDNGSSTRLTSGGSGSPSTGSWLDASVALSDNGDLEFTIDSVTVSANDSTYDEVYLGMQTFEASSFVDDVQFATL